jgi:zinc D-Ala-D-Ala carboxypeptidase
MAIALSAHFLLEEFVVSQEAVRAGIDNTPSAEVQENLVRLAQALEEIRALLGNRSILISSGYRCPQLNERIGGAPTSAHLDGRAADFIVPAIGTPYEIAARIAASNVPFEQLIHEYGSWVHVAIPRKGEPPQRQLLSIFKKGRYLAGILPDQSHLA